ncbi:MAG: hypothetical protein ABL997_02270 [Planctomycetota bacterium]
MTTRRERLHILAATLFGTLVGVVWFFGWFGFAIMNGDLDADAPPAWTAADTLACWMMVATLVLGPVAGLGLAFVWHLASRRR